MDELIETPAEREAKLNERNAKINAAIAENLAMEMVAKADQERILANAALQENREIAREATAARFNSRRSDAIASDAKRDAEKSKLGLWLLASFVAIALFIGTALWANRNNDTQVASSASQPQVITRTVVVTPSPVPLTTPPPTVVREYVPVPVPAPAQPAPAPIQGYVAPGNRTAPRLVTPTPAPVPGTVVPTEKAPVSSDTPLRGYMDR